MRKKLLFIVLDGIGDRFVPELENSTPLEAAYTPTLDKLAHEGATGLVQVLPFAPESDTAIFTLLGYDLKDYTGRGSLEALGTSMKFSKGMLALRCNFATCEGTKLIDRRAGRNLTSKEANLLANSINKNVKLKNAKFILKSTVAHRGVLMLQHKKRLSSRITNTDPAYKIVNGAPEALSEFKMELLKSRPLERSAKLSADLLNEFTEKSIKVLSNDPVNLQRQHRGLLKANVILCRDAGNELPKIKPINQLTKRNWAIAADMPLEIGIGKLTGMKIIDISDASVKGFRFIAEKVVESLKEYDSIYIHVKGPDVFGHDGDYNGKMRCIEEIDKKFLKHFVRELKGDTMIVITGDHSTPCELKGHSSDPIPLLVWNSGIKDDVKRFNEVECSSGKLGILKGTELMQKICNLANQKN